MYKITTVQTRPNTSVAFWTKENPALTAEYLNYYRDTYIVTGKHLNFDSEVSADGLTLTTVVIWDSEASVNTWKADSVCQAGFFDPQAAYLESNGIAITRSAEEI